MENTIDPIDDLIGKVLAGEATAEEKNLLEVWLRKDDGNRTYFDQLKTIFEKAASSSVHLQVDTDAAWKKVKQKLPADKTGTRWLMDWRLAASVLLAISVGYSIFVYTRPVIQDQSFTSQGGTQSDTLPDGSRAFLNKKTEIQFTYNSREKIRHVKFKGEAFFAVKHEETKPFIIETDEVLIKDIGTAFNVKSFVESQTVEVIVEEGEVQFYTLLDSGLNLTAGERGVYDKAVKKFSKLVKIDTNSLSYKTKVFSFNNTDLASVIEKLNEVYGSSITLVNPALKDCHLTVNFSDDKLDTIIEVLAETLNLTISRKGESISLDGKGCNE